MCCDGLKYRSHKKHVDAGENEASMCRCAARYVNTCRKNTTGALRDAAREPATKEQSSFASKAEAGINKREQR